VIGLHEDSRVPSTPSRHLGALIDGATKVPLG
jgi:hypothetical protein